MVFLQVIYRIKLPGPAILGEGKPENQNHAIIFTRGEGLQTIDMNQVWWLLTKNLLDLGHYPLNNDHSFKHGTIKIKLLNE